MTETKSRSREHNVWTTEKSVCNRNKAAAARITSGQLKNHSTKMTRREQQGEPSKGSERSERLTSIIHGTENHSPLFEIDSPLPQGAPRFILTPLALGDSTPVTTPGPRPRPKLSEAAQLAKLNYPTKYAAFITCTWHGSFKNEFLMLFRIIWIVQKIYCNRRPQQRTFSRIKNIYAQTKRIPPN